MTPIEPRWWRQEDHPEGQKDLYRCDLCFHQCSLTEGGVGYCGARGVSDSPSRFVSPYLGYFSSFAVDPVEKKPLSHWRPGSRIFSLGSLGCNMRCPFCQNHTISRPGQRPNLNQLAPEDLRSQIQTLGLSAVAYTYNEPMLQAEYILAAAPLLREAGIATVMVTNGMFSPALLLALSVSGWIDAANIDLKTFNSVTYAKLGGSLDAVKNTITHLVRGGTHVELTTLVVPGLSDDLDEFADLTDWVAALSRDIPLHISRYFLAAEFTAPPTDLDLLDRFRRLAASRLHHVHLGNVGNQF
ncbi:MAG: radical SAM protein [Candidatus Adiutrix sp.]|jgi:pyruvate formate lyase activating enzyme|nr:radical SAM protein [Candidatus Adiutrix sp.]